MILLYTVATIEYIEAYQLQVRGNKLSMKKLKGMDWEAERDFDISSSTKQQILISLTWLDTQRMFILEDLLNWSGDV